MAPARAGSGSRGRSGARPGAGRPFGARTTRPRAPAPWLRSLTFALGVGAPGCGGALPLAEPPTPVAAGELRGGVGVATQLAGGRWSDQAARARAVAADAPTRTADAWAGVVGGAAIAPGVSPWVSARLGLGEGRDVGLAYTGRALRLSPRFALHEAGSLVITADLGGSATFLDPGGRTVAPGVGVGGVSGFGADGALLAGWHSDGALVHAWAGPRLGLGAHRGEVELGALPDAPRLRAQADHRWAGATLGFSVGVRPLTVALAVDAAWFALSGQVDEAPVGGARRPFDTSGWTLAPAGALLGRFE